MIIDCVVTATNLNPLYIEFIPIFIKYWKKLLPEVDVKIILIAEEIPEEYLEYSNNIILFKPIDGIESAFISQYIRLLYPAILNYKNGILITDMDILPMNRDYYTKNIESYTNDKFITYREPLHDEIYMCYNIATPQLWGEVFSIYSIDDIISKLIKANNEIIYEGVHGGTGWCKDQNDLFTRLYSNKNLVILSDKETGYNRLDRHNFILDRTTKQKIAKGEYTDYHAYRPYSEQKYITDKILELL